MLFAHDTEMALRGAAALVNTAPTLPTDTEDLATVADLDAFVRQWEWTGSRAHDDTELASVHALRPRLRQLWTAETDQAVELVNALLAEAGALPQLVRHGEWSWHLHATPPEAPLATRMAVEAAMAMVDVIRADELARLRVCAAEDCEDVVIDLSKNRSKRFCDGGCGNRANVAAYRARKAGAP
ncbi:putative RNA-binding Zn ribbon-like protein [Phycicoccus badiiscoriae]|uniref:Putative RNA-binding Zn ribbon-like protein n=1 Tax=Pedococcus badiiscoriae TaxID=642776 RepID=A0A852WF15_9MICO|nr:CGNR zinc finger domain-containing protein [Pedococcus badiiscoriae]NYG07369.1 putative RNA-binding Zn ribbon-like protein [Pedococcus badiiscoriae]